MLDCVARLEADHAGLESGIDGIDGLDPSSDEWCAGAVSVLDDLAAHVWVEEYDVFPAAIVGLSTDGWDRLIDAEPPAPAGTGTRHAHALDAAAMAGEARR